MLINKLCKIQSTQVYINIQPLPHIDKNMLTYIQPIIITMVIQATHTLSTYQLNNTIHMDRSLNIICIALAPKPITTESNKTVDMAVALRQKLLYITSSTAYNPDIRYVCDCVIVRVDWFEDGIFIVSNNMVMLIDPFNFRNKTLLNTNDTIVFADYGNGRNRKYISICYSTNRVQVFQNTTSILNITIANACKTMTFDALAYYLHFYDDNAHYFVNMTDLSVSHINLFVGPIASVIPQNQCSFSDKILSISKSGYISEWRKNQLVFQRLIDSSLNKSSKIYLQITTECQFLAVYSQQGLEGTLILWQFQNSKNVLLNWHKNVSFKYGIKTLDSQNGKIVIMNDVNQYKVYIRVQITEKNFNILWIIVPSAALILIIIIIVIIKTRTKKVQEEDESRIVERHLSTKVERSSIKQRKSKSDIQQRMSKGDLQQPINKFQNFYANQSDVRNSKNRMSQGTPGGKKMMLQEESMRKSNKKKYMEKEKVKQSKDGDDKKRYYQFNSEIDEYTILDRPPQ